VKHVAKTLESNKVLAHLPKVSHELEEELCGLSDFNIVMFRDWLDGGKHMGCNIVNFHITRYHKC
jgi:hypothetical protein